MKGLLVNRIVPLVVVVLTLAAAGGLVMLKHSVRLAAGGTVPVAAAAPVSTVVRACPAPGLAGSTAQRVALVAGPPARSPATRPSATGPGSAVVSRLGTAKATPLLRLTQPGVLSVSRVPSAPAAGHAVKASPAPSGQPVTTPVQGGVVVRATGAMARGLEAEQATPDGTVSARCGSPGTDFWFVGLGRYSVAHIQLHLMNTSSQPADVNVDAITDAGPLQGSTDTGIAVAPDSMVVQSLDTMLHGSRVIALHVRTSVGQVVAGVAEATGKSSAGTWLPAAQAPATSVVVPGLPATPGTRQVLVAVPGTQDAHITLVAVTSRGAYQPTGGTGLDIPGGSAVSISLPSLAGIPAALKVTATVPVTASVLLPGGQHGSPGVFTAAAPPVEQQGVAAVNLSGSGKVSDLVLSAPGNAVTARISATGQHATPGQTGPARTVRIAARHTLVVAVPRPRGTKARFAFAVVIVPLAGSGPLYAGRVLAGSGRGGAVQSILPVASAISSVPLPPLRNAPFIPAP